jgi:hypothetical protein
VIKSCIVPRGCVGFPRKVSRIPRKPSHPCKEVIEKTEESRRAKYHTCKPLIHKNFHRSMGWGFEAFSARPESCLKLYSNE